MLWKPNGIQEPLASTPKLWLGTLPESVKSHIRIQAGNGWRFFPVNQERGRCYYTYKVITIPLWVIRSNRIGQFAWYVSHELAHTYSLGDIHGPRFMRELRNICPVEFQHYEIEYKPRNAIAAGIRRACNSTNDML